MKFSKLPFYITTAFLCTSSILGSKALADEVLSHLYTPSLSDGNLPWFTGPLLAPSAHTLPPGHGDVEPYLFFTTVTGVYNEHWNVESIPNFYQLNLIVPAWIGLTSFLDFTFAPQVFYSFSQGERSTQFGDVPFGFDIQLLNDQEKTWWPAIKLGLQVIAPTGKYKNLNPKDLGTDGVGIGSWTPKINLTFGRLFLLSNNHFLAPRLALTYLIGTPVHVSNYNSYGGTLGTLGKIYPGNDFSVDFGCEYNLTQRWVVALDIFYDYQNKTKFSGNPGEIAPGIPAVLKSPSSEQFSLAPALEYNWSSNVGMIGGVWFTIAGRNASQFVSGVLALNIYI